MTPMTIAPTPRPRRTVSITFCSESSSTATRGVRLTAANTASTMVLIEFGRRGTTHGNLCEFRKRSILRDVPRWRIHQDQRLAQDFFADDRIAVGTRWRDRQLDASIVEQLLQHRAALLPDLQVHLRVLRADLLDQRQREARDHRR